MEKSQTKPTVAMLESLFQSEEPKKKPLILEKKTVEENPKVSLPAGEAGFQEKLNHNNKL